MDGILKSSLLSSRCWPGHRKARLDCNIFCIFNMQQNRDLHILNIPLWEKFLAYLTPRRVAIFLFRVATFSPSCTTSLKLTSTPRYVNMFYILRFIEEKTGDPRRVNFWCTFYITKIICTSSPYDNSSCPKYSWHSAKHCVNDILVHRCEKVNRFEHSSNSNYVGAN